MLPRVPECPHSLTIAVLRLLHTGGRRAGARSCVLRWVCLLAKRRISPVQISYEIVPAMPAPPVRPAARSSRAASQPRVTLGGSPYRVMCGSLPTVSRRLRPMGLAVLGAARCRYVVARGRWLEQLIRRRPSSSLPGITPSVRALFAQEPAQTRVRTRRLGPHNRRDRRAARSRLDRASSPVPR
jgi:hypothetical protein